MITKTALRLKLRLPKPRVPSALIRRFPSLAKVKPEHLRYVNRGVVTTSALGGGTYIGNNQYKRRRRRKILKPTVIGG